MLLRNLWNALHIDNKSSVSRDCISKKEEEAGERSGSVCKRDQESGCENAKDVQESKMAATMVETPPPQLITTIEWGMMDKSKFFPLYTLSSFTVRCALYPLTLVKTQIQVQRKKEAYKGVTDAITNIYKNEGVSGLYRGFWLSSFQIISGVFYISTYEGVRHELGKYDISPRMKSFIGGGCASIVGQTIIVPFDVLSQHLMVLGLVKSRAAAGMSATTLNPLGLDLTKRYSRAALAREVAMRVYSLHGVLGYYRGYAASLAAYVPNSALWWALYQAYQDELLRISPLWVSHLLIQCVAGTLGGFTTTILTNPLDIVRARLQVEGVGSMRHVFKELWREEGLVGLYAKGLSARLVQSACFSFSIILGYETIKRVAVSDEYRTRVRW
ncbi:solute carrier family 25 member 44 [Pectinophora gossypiella]|uniref:Solute carrier family 25 member 44 n=1 Tax=Pectinophora gossypiella TaxID=13191 RepID=A0A1E1W554_PECGO|nr:solute carrier family 25 member 44 [Pectinophora gossypiella]